MLDKNTLDSVYRDIADGGYLDDWVLNCARAMRDQAKQAIELAAENERLKNTLNSIEFLLQTQNDGADKTSMIRDLMANTIDKAVTRHDQL